MDKENEMQGVVTLSRETFMDYVSVLQPSYRAWARFRLEHDNSPSKDDITLSAQEFKHLKAQVESVVNPPEPANKPKTSARFFASVAENLFGVSRQAQKSDDFMPDRTHAAEVLTQLNTLVPN